MVLYTDVMYNLGGAAVTTLTQMNSGTSSTAGTYSPQLNGTLKKIDIMVTPQAATSLAESGRIELSQTNWKPNILRFAFPGFGLQTVVGRGSDGWNRAGSYLVEQPVQTDWPITGNIIYFFSPVTPNAVITGTFIA